MPVGEQAICYERAVGPLVKLINPFLIRNPGKCSMKLFSGNQIACDQYVWLAEL